jgi:dTMP kinase
MPRSLFLSLDGLDGAGKSTQCRLLADWLRSLGRTVVECADPGGTAVGDELRKILLGGQHHLALPCEMLLFMASRAQLVAEVIRPALEAGRTVLCDRFLLANVVYQGHGGGLDPDTLWEIGRVATGDVLPDLTLVLDLPPGKAAARRSRVADRFESRNEDYQRRVRDGFRAEARRFPESIRVIDADQPADAVHCVIRAEVSRVLATREGT